MYQGQHPKKGMREQARSLLIYQAPDVGSSPGWMATRACSSFCVSAEVWFNLLNEAQRFVAARMWPAV